MLQRYHPAALAAAAAALATSPQELLAALRRADQDKDAAPPAAAPGPRLLTMKECAVRLGTCKRTVKNRIDDGMLPAKKIGSRFVRVLEQDLMDFIDGMPERAPRAGSVVAK